MNRSILYFFLAICFLHSCQAVHDRNAHRAKDPVDWKKMDGPARFLAYHQLIRTRADQVAPEYRSGDLHKAYRRAINRINPKKRSSPLPWVERGPGNVGGRTRGLWVAPEDTTLLTVYAGSAGGGIWKTEDGGIHWQNLTEDIPNLSTTTIAGSPSNPMVLYAGTGEGFGASRNIVGQGLLKSIDAGETWIQMNATANRDDIAVVYRIVVNPHDENQFLFSSLIHPRRNLGDSISHIMKSDDGGEEIRTTYVSDRAVQQLVAHPLDFQILYGVINGAGLIQSNNGGDEWTPLLEVDTFRRMEMAIAPTAPEIMYLAGERRVGDSDQNSSTLLCSMNAGESWFRVFNDGEPHDFGDWFQGQGWYNNAIAIHPYDSNIVFVGGAGPILQIEIDYFDTTHQQFVAHMEPLTDSYETYRNIGYADASSKGVHVDHHNLILLPSDSAKGGFHIYNANDGGVAISLDNGQTFLQTGASFSEECIDPSCNQIRRFPFATGYNTSQFYGVDKANGIDRYVGGTQDNGSWVSASDPQFDSEWVHAPGGDGFEAIWHYNDPQKLIETAQFNTMVRSDDGGISWRLLSPPGEGPFLTRLAGSRQEPDLIFGVTEEGLIRSTNFGEDWEIISMPEGWRFEGLATPVRISLANPNIVWSGAGLSQSSGISVSRNRGSDFTPIKAYGEAVLGVMTNIATHPDRDSTAYFLFSQANGPKVIRTRDLGTTLEDISGFTGNQPSSSNGFPDVATYSLLVMPYDDQILWAGTEIGLFESRDNGISWQYADNGLPPASIWDMKIVNDQVIVATHGRGVWTVSLPGLVGYEPKEASFLSPGISLNDYAFDGLLQGSLQLKTHYDSSRFDVSYRLGTDTIRQTLPLEGNDAAVELPFNYALGDLSSDTMVRVEISMKSYQDGVYLEDRSSVLAFDVKEGIAEDYFNNFDQGELDFARYNFSISQPSNFDNFSLNSPHPYQGRDDHAAVFQRPVVITQEGPEIAFEEIVLVEPGDSETFPSTDFFDYCLIDATTNRGTSWQTIAGYDSRDNADWLAAYEDHPFRADPGLARKRIVDLSEYFAMGDTVFLRFRLVSDPFVEGWGWQIDNFSVGSLNTAISTGNEDSFTIRILSNPSSQLGVEISSSHPVSGTLSLFAMNGQRVIQKEINGGFHEFVQGLGGNLSPDLYLVVIQMGDVQRTLKWIKQ